MAKDGGGFAKVLLLHVAALSTAGAVAAAVALAQRRLWGDRRRKQRLQAPAPATAMAEMPRLQLAESGRLEYLEKFSHYVARQLGFDDMNECPQLCKLANNYLNNTPTCMEDIFGFFSSAKDAEGLYVKLIEELDKCILGYFAFHWNHATYFITSALTADTGTKRKLRNMVLEATRKQRFERVTRDLKVTRVFSTLVEEMKAIGGIAAAAECTDVMAPSDMAREVASRTQPMRPSTAANTLRSHDMMPTPGIHSPPPDCHTTREMPTPRRLAPTVPPPTEVFDSLLEFRLDVPRLLRQRPHGFLFFHGMTFLFLPIFFPFHTDGRGRAVVAGWAERRGDVGVARSRNLIFENISCRDMLPLQVFLVCLIAGSSICWFNTVCFVLCIRSLSANNRSLALSLSISFNGLSAAFYPLFANALAPSSPAVYLLLNALLPFGVSVLALPAILLCHKNDGHLQSAPRHDRRVFLGLYILACITGIYLVVFGSFTATSSTAWVILTGAMVLLALPFIIPACSSCSYDTDGPDPASLHKPLLVSNNHQMESNAMVQKPMEHQTQGNCCGTIVSKGRLAALNEEHSAKKLIRCVDFWLYYTAYFCGATVGLVYSNNLGQIAQSLQQQSQLTMLLAVYSSSSFFGRLLSALPDILNRKMPLARTGWLAAALVPMPMAFFLMWNQQDASTLVAGTAIVGLSSGFIFAAAVSVTSELFGPNSVGVNHNILITNIPLGSFLYGQIAAMVYDGNGQKKTVMDNRTGIVETMTVCMGMKCYSTTFFLWACITFLGLASSIVLFIRTKPAYATTASRSSCKHLHQVSS